MSLTYLICMTVVEAVIFLSLGYALADYRQQRAEQARRDEQQTNERNRR
jgi:hypothetical protein